MEAHATRNPRRARDVDEVTVASPPGRRHDEERSVDKGFQ